MPYRTLTILLQFIAFACIGQTGVIKGIVLDGKSLKPLPYASVYINQTTIGTNTDDHGEFILTKLPEGEIELVASYVGFEPFREKFSPNGVNDIVITVRLNPLQLKEVQVFAKRDATWDKQLVKFKKLFLGTGPNASLCKILNPWVLTFQEVKGTFLAQATGVLEVENLGLGYRINYELRNFAVNRDNYLVAGYVRFQELQTIDSVLTKRWTKNRNEAFRGSPRHLYQSIVEHCLEEEEYELYEDKSELKQVVRYDRLASNLDKNIFRYPMDASIIPGQKPHTYKIYFPPRLEVHYKNKNTSSRVYWDVPYPVSWIEVRGGFVNVTDDGIVLNPSKVTISGYMFNARIADLLPNDYQPEKKIAIYQNPVEKKPLSKLAYLTEKPYLHTDKSCYFSNEIIWFKGYMNYMAPMLKDSLSHVLSVDLLSADHKIVMTRNFPVTGGTVVGNIVLPATISPGDYSLRAYTRWMLNFDPGYMFVKPIRILDSDELVRTKDYRPDDTVPDNIIIGTEKDQFDPREKITLNLDARDDLDNSTPANLSVSITDLKQAFPASNETSILSDFAMPAVTIPDTLSTTKRHLIQRGFDLSGRFVPSKKKPVQGMITLVQEDANMEFVYTTETDGSFVLPNLLLYDTAKLSIVGKSIRGKPGKVVLDSAIVLPPFRSANPLQVEIFKTDQPARYYIPDDTNDTRILEEVTISASRIETKKRSIVLADYEVTGDWIRESHITDVLRGIQMKIPGMRIIVAQDLTKYIILGAPSGFGDIKSQEPLVLIDNIVVNDMFGGPAAQIDMLNPNEIENIEVTKYGNGASYGARGGNGIISIHTRRGTLNENTATRWYDKSMLQRVHKPGFSATKKFRSPDYSTPERMNAVPDYRSTIYWNPSVTTDGKKPTTVSFFAADLPTQYRIVVEGVTAAGRPVRGEKIVVIKKLP